MEWLYWTTGMVVALGLFWLVLGWLMDALARWGRGGSFWGR